MTNTNSPFTIMLPRAQLDEDWVKKSFTVIDGGRYLIDANDDVWFVCDDDGTYLTYAKDTRVFGDKVRMEMVN